MWASILSIGANVLKGALALIGWRKQVSDQNTGKTMERADEQATVLKETQAVNDARGDPANIERVQDASYRD